MGTSDAPRVAVMSVHTSPVDQPGIGDAGGMNVYIRAVAERLADRGVAVDLFTRCRGGVDHEDKAPGVGESASSPSRPGRARRSRRRTCRGTCPSSSAACSGTRTTTAAATTSSTATTGSRAGSGRAAKEVWGAPLVASFHTLGKVKNYSLARGESGRGAVRLEGEQRVIDVADRILAPTPVEAGQLVGLYRADPEHIRLVPPGVDHRIFTPRDRAARGRACT